MVPATAETSATLEPTDAELARRVTGGPDPEGAFDELYARHANRLLAILRNKFANSADDLAQEAWARAFERLRKGEVAEMTNFRGWLCRIATNRGTDEVRRRRPDPLPDGDATPDARRPLPIDVMLDAERKEAVRRCLEGLDPDQRDVIVANSSGEKPVDTAARLGISRDAVDQRKSRAIGALRSCVERRLKAEGPAKTDKK